VVAGGVWVASRPTLDPSTRSAQDSIDPESQIEGQQPHV
jgi:hypothetical protein